MTWKHFHFTGPLWGESTDDRGIPLTTGQWFWALLFTLILAWTSYCINSLAPGKFEWNFRYVIFKRILVIGGWGISCEIALIWMSLDFTDDQTSGKLLDLYRTGGLVATWKIQVLLVLQNFYRTLYNFFNIRVPIEGLPTGIFYRAGGPAQ